MEPLREIRNRLLNGWQLSKLHTFEVAARHQSFALAAEELSLSPSAVSHRINQLEEELGIQLFVRSHRKVEYQMEKITTGVSYTTSAVGTGYWFLQLLDRVSPSQWAAIGVLGSLLFGLLTYLTNLYFKIREDRRKAARGE